MQRSQLHTVHAEQSSLTVASVSSDSASRILQHIADYVKEAFADLREIPPPQAQHEHSVVQIDRTVQQRPERLREQRPDDASSIETEITHHAAERKWLEINGRRNAEKACEDQAATILQALSDRLVATLPPSFFQQSLQKIAARTLKSCLLDDSEQSTAQLVPDSTNVNLCPEINHLGVFNSGQGGTLHNTDKAVFRKREYFDLDGEQTARNTESLQSTASIVLCEQHSDDEQGGSAFAYHDGISESIASSREEGAHDDWGNTHQAEVTACAAACPDSMRLMRNVLQIAEPSSLPTSPAQAAGLDVGDGIDKSSSNGESFRSGNLRAKRKKPGSPDNTYKRAVAIAKRLPQELGSVDVLSELQLDLQRERARIHHKAQQRYRANLEPRSQSEENASKYSETLKDAYYILQRSPRLETAIDRYRRILIAQRYRTALQDKGKHSCSVAEDFARRHLPDKVTKGLSKKKLQEKWKPIIHQHQFWEQLAASCGGAGVLLLLPADFQNEHARRLRSDDRAALFVNIAARHRNLKDDVQVLTDLLSYFFSKNALPEWQIPLENFPKADIAAWRQRGLRELVGVVTSRWVRNGATPPPPC